MFRITVGAVLMAGLLAIRSSAQTILFDFDSATIHSSLPVNIVSGGVNAYLSSSLSNYNYSVQDAAVLGFTPAGFSGLCIYPNTIYASDLNVSFDQVLSDFSILYSDEEYGCDTAARMKATAYMSGQVVGYSTTYAQAGTWPTATLSYSNPTGFDSVVIHYDAPPQGENWGPIFMVDNMNIVIAPEPLTASGFMFLIAAGALTRRR